MECSSARCPTCNHPVEVVTSAEGNRKPKSGDYGCCIQCGCLLQYRGATVHQISPENWKQMELGDVWYGKAKLFRASTAQERME